VGAEILEVGAYESPPGDQVFATFGSRGSPLAVFTVIEFRPYPTGKAWTRLLLLRERRPWEFVVRAL